MIAAPQAALIPRSQSLVPVRFGFRQPQNVFRQPVRPGKHDNDGTRRHIVDVVPVCAHCSPARMDSPTGPYIAKRSRSGSVGNYLASSNCGTAYSMGPDLYRHKPPPDNQHHSGISLCGRTSSGRRISGRSLSRRTSNPYSIGIALRNRTACEFPDYFCDAVRSHSGRSAHAAGAGAWVRNRKASPGQDYGGDGGVRIPRQCRSVLCALTDRRSGSSRRRYGPVPDGIVFKAEPDGDPCNHGRNDGDDSPALRKHLKHAGRRGPGGPFEAGSRVWIFVLYFVYCGTNSHRCGKVTDPDTDNSHAYDRCCHVRRTTLVS